MERRDVTRKHHLLLVVLSWVPAISVIAAQDTALKPLTIQLRWAHQFQFAGYYAAKGKGVYAEERLDVSLRMPYPRISPMSPSC